MKADTVAPVLDVRDALENLGDDPDLYREIIEIFTAEVPIFFEKLIISLQGSDLATLAENAHRLKGMTSAVGGSRFAVQMGVLQRLAQDTACIDHKGWLETITDEYQKLLGALTQLDLKQFS